MSQNIASAMLREIRQQPEVIQRLLSRELSNVEALAAAARARNVALMLIAARGTSDHAAIYAKYLTEIVAGLPVSLAAPSVFTLYDSEVRLGNALVLGISQSGKAADALEVLRKARRQHQLTGAITNDPGSPLSTAVEHPLYCQAGLEEGLPATKTYTASLALACALTAYLGSSPGLLDDLKRVPEWMAQVLRLEDQVAEKIERYRYMEECVILARGLNQCSALETALKLSETSYIRAHPFSAADFLHGPIAVVDEGYPCMLFAPSGKSLPVMREVSDQLKSRSAEIIVVSDDADLLQGATTALPMPPVPEWVSPLVGILISQLFAFHLARVKGRDPDRPRGLKKVTHTL